MNFSAVLSLFSSKGRSYRKGIGGEFIDLNGLTMVGELLCISSHASQRCHEAGLSGKPGVIVRQYGFDPFGRHITLQQHIPAFDAEVVSRVYQHQAEHRRG